MCAGISFSVREKGPNMVGIYLSMELNLLLSSVKSTIMEPNCRYLGPVKPIFGLIYTKQSYLCSKFVNLCREKLVYSARD